MSCNRLRGLLTLLPRKEVSRAMTIREWCAAAQANSLAHGFTNDHIPTALMLIVTEAAEAMERWREVGPGNDDVFASELADICLRTFILAEALGIDLEAAIEAKHARNLTRPYLHGGKLA